MPKETICDVATMYDLEVGWEADRWVQVGIKTHDGRSLAEHLSGDSETPANFIGLWGTYDRAGINRLIRILRRARDSAFGADA